MADSMCPCGGEDCEGVNDGGRHQCGGPAEACCVPGCQECGAHEAGKEYMQWLDGFAREKALAAARREGFNIAREHACLDVNRFMHSAEIDWTAAEKELTKREQAKASGA